MLLMRCGDVGFKTVAGTPCRQQVLEGKKGCLWHGTTKEEQAAYRLKGRVVQTMKKALPEDAVPFSFDNEDTVITFAQDMAKQALCANVDQHRIKTGLEAAKVALSGFNAKTTARMVKALESLEHGGAAMILLSQMSERLGTGTTRALPGRVTKTESAA